MENEITYTILGFHLWKFYFGWGMWLVEGEPVMVQFQADKILKYRKWVIAFWHTHPKMAAYPSNIDIKTMYQWCDALGRSIYCLIEGNGYFGDHPTEPVIENYLFETDPMSVGNDEFKWGGEAKRIGRFFFWKGA